MSKGRQALLELVEKDNAESATGCMGAGDYRQWAQAQGYQFCEVVDWTSSAGDWTFIVSEDGFQWHIMSQANNWPRAGFTRTVSEETFWGTAEEAMQEVIDLYW